MTTGRSARAEEILDQALRLFAERGYGATSVADIQAAAGMTPGSGALYKHFPAKEALLGAGVDRFIAEARAQFELTELDGDDVRGSLHTLGTRILDTLSLDHAAFRIVWRDLGAFPKLKQRVIDERIQPGFDLVAGWLQQAADQGHIEVNDPHATATVLLSSMVFFRLMDILLGEPPGGLDDERFLDTWVDLAVNTLMVADHRR